jgi:acetyltransferase-like isoleucine patch superfamily enzyme
MNRGKPEQDPLAYEKAFSSFTKRSLRRLRKQPYIFLPGATAYLRGLYYKFKFKVLLKDIKIGKHFRVYGRFVVTGPGQVTFGDDCFIMSHVIKTVRIRTLLPNSNVVFGNHVGLNGTSIVCSKQISIDDFSNIADAYITDSPAHPISIDRRLYAPPDIPAESVRIGRNVWVSVNVVILKGVNIGDNTVIGACSQVRKSLPANVLAAGIPATIIQELPESYSPENK